MSGGTAKVGDALYAIVRLDAFAVGAAGVTVRAVLAKREEAEAEVRRLNGRAPSGTTYFWQATRLATPTPIAGEGPPLTRGPSRAPSARPSSPRRRRVASPRTRPPSAS